MIEIGSIIGRKYRILKPLGKGGMGFVFLAEDLELKKPWAIKLLKPEETFSTEIEILKFLNHPLAPRVVDSFEEKNFLCFVMDYIEGENLQSILQREAPLNQERVCKWMIDVCDLLDYLHKNNVVYRDLKPLNMMQGAGDRIYLVDFGFPTKIVKDGDFTDEKAFGTAGYAAPEQFKHYSDPHSDIYAAGVTLFQLLTGKSPVEKGFSPVNARKYRKDLDSGLEKIIEKAVKQNPKERFSSMEEFSDALKNYKKLESPRIEKLKRKIFISKALLFCGIFLMLLGILSTETLWLKNLSSYNHLIQKNAIDSNPPKEEILKAIALMPERCDAYIALAQNFQKETFTEKELEEFEKYYEKYEKTAFFKKEGYAKLNYQIAFSYLSGTSDMEFSDCLSRLNPIKSHLLKACNGKTFGNRARSLYNLSEGYDYLNASYSLLKSHFQLIGNGAFSQRLFEYELILEVFIKNPQIVPKEKALKLFDEIKKAMDDISYSEEDEKIKQINKTLKKVQEVL